MPRDKLLTIVDDALPARQHAALRRRVAGLKTERLARTYQTTFWFDLGPPTNVVEEAILALWPRVRRRAEGRARGVEWWLSRMRTTDVRVDFHQDRDERLALQGGPLVHPLYSSVLFLNRVQGGLLAVTTEPPCEDNPACAPKRLDLALAAPRPNRFVLFDGALTHGVLDRDHQIPTRRLAGPAPLRLAVAINWWERRPTQVPTFEEARVYRSLAVGRRAAVRR